MVLTVRRKVPYHNSKTHQIVYCTDHKLHFKPRSAGIEPAFTQPKRIVLPLNYNLFKFFQPILQSANHSESFTFMIQGDYKALYWNRTSILSAEDSSSIH
jgi:hypothetical protein